MDQKLVFFDLETGGVDPRRHPIIQIAAIAVDKTLSPLEAFEAKIRFDKKKANRHSLRKNHYSPGLWATEAHNDAEVGHEFASFLKRYATLPRRSRNGDEYFVAQLVAHNGAFDGPFLQSWYERLGIFLPASRTVLCTLQRAMWYFSERPHLTPPKDFKLATVCHHLGVPFHAAAAHEALADTSATVGLYRALNLGSERPLRTIAA